MRTTQLLTQFSLTDLFTHVFVLVDDHLKLSVQAGRLSLPDAPDRKGSLSELMTIALVGDLLGQHNTELWIEARPNAASRWFELVKHDYAALFPILPDRTRYHRILNNCERLFADFGLSLVRTTLDTLFVIDSMPLPICKGARFHRPRQETQMAIGTSGLGWVQGYRLHAVVSSEGMICRFALTAANLGDVTVAKVLLDAQRDELGSVLGDKGYLGAGIWAPSRRNAKHPNFWSPLMRRARKTVETVFSHLTRWGHIALGQLNSFRAVRTKVCRKVAAHNLSLYLSH